MFRVEDLGFRDLGLTDFGEPKPPKRDRVTTTRFLQGPQYQRNLILLGEGGSALFVLGHGVWGCRFS